MAKLWIFLILISSSLGYADQCVNYFEGYDKASINIPHMHKILVYEMKKYSGLLDAKIGQLKSIPSGQGISRADIQEFHDFIIVIKIEIISIVSFLESKESFSPSEMTRVLKRVEGLGKIETHADLFNTHYNRPLGSGILIRNQLRGFEIFYNQMMGRSDFGDTVHFLN